MISNHKANEDLLMVHMLRLSEPITSYVAIQTWKGIDLTAVYMYRIQIRYELFELATFYIFSN